MNGRTALRAHGCVTWRVAPRARRLVGARGALRARGWLRSHGVLMALGVMACVSVSCTPQKARAPSSIEAFRQAQEARVAATSTVTAAGTLELRWRDEQGTHFETADLHWWLQRPAACAIVLKKLGERVAIAGTDGTRSWVIDDRQAPPTLRVLGVGDEPVGWAQALLPLHLVWLMGIAPIPTAAPDRLWDEAGLAWAQWEDRAIGWDAEGRACAARVGTGDPIAAESTIDAREWRALNGVMVLPGHCSLRSPQHEGAADLYLYEPARFEPGSKDRVMLFDALVETLKPVMAP